MNTVTKDSSQVSTPLLSGVYYRLIAVWVLCEAMLGGIIHGLKIPVSGLVVGSCAIVCICMIGWYVPVRGAILKATIIVAVFKMMLSPQAPPPAYIAVFFQGLLGELLLRKKQFYTISCILLAVLGLLESGFQRILMLTIVYGNDFWKVINDFINGLTKQKTTTNYSLLIGGGYVLLHLLTGIFIGWWASKLPGRIEKWRINHQLIVSGEKGKELELPERSKRRRSLRMGIFIVWILLIALYVQSYFRIGEPILPAHISLKILIRSLIIILGWIFIVGPLLKQILHKWLKKKQSSSQRDVSEVMKLLPVMQQVTGKAWKQSAGEKGWKRINAFCKTVLVNTLSPQPDTKTLASGIYLLTGPIQSGKTTSLVKWSENRDDVFGILTPDVDGKRVFMNARNRQLFLMEARDGEQQVLSVGRFVFSKTNFDRAINIIRDNMHQPGWLVIDEIGPMELRGEGFHDVVQEVLEKRKGNILIVVREKDGMMEKITNKFKITSATVVRKPPMS